MLVTLLPPSYEKEILPKSPGRTFCVLEPTKYCISSPFLFCYIYLFYFFRFLWGDGSEEGWDGGRGLRGTVQFSSVDQSCPTPCNPMNHSTPGLPVHHQLPEFTQTHAHRVGDAIQPSHPLSSPSPPAPNRSQHKRYKLCTKQNTARI